MREIELRFWDSKNKKYNYFTLGNIMCYSDIFQKHILNGDNPEQYTGLKDKNDKEIYEGDLIRVVIKNSSNRVISDYIGEVVYQDAKYNLFVSGRIKTNLAGFSMSWTTFEVVGNIHENEDLLK